MKKFKEFYVKALILLLAFLLIYTLVCVAVYHNQQSAVMKEYQQSSIYNVTAGSVAASRAVEEIVADANADNEGAFDRIGTMNGNYLTVTGVENRMYINETMKSLIYGSTVNFFNFKYLSEQAPDDERYMITTVGDTLYMLSESNFSKRFNDAAFSDYMIVGESGKTFLSSGVTADIAHLSAELKTGIFSEKVTVAGKQYLVYSAHLDVNTAAQTKIEYYYVGLVDFSAVSAQINGTTLNIAAVLLIATVALIALYMGFAYWLTRTSSFHEKVAIKYSFYLVNIDKNGNVTRANAPYKDDYGNANVFQSVTARSSKRHFMPGESFLSAMEDKNGAKHLVSFIITGTTKVGFKLFGKTVDEIMATFDVSQNVNDSESIKNQLAKTYNKIAPTAKQLLFGVVRINNLKNLEAMFGREFSEKLFLAISQRIKKHFDTIYILPGELIGVFITDINMIGEYIKEMPDILSDLNKPLLIDGNLVNVGCKAGFVMADSVLKEADFDYLYRCARAALKRVTKEDATFYVFHESQKRLYARYMEVAYDIPRMLENNSFELEYQPQYNIKTNKISGFEALFRVRKGLQLKIDVFELIRYAERTGKMILLGDYIFNTGMKFAKSIEGLGIAVSLNVSPIQMMQAGFVDNFLRMYNSYNLKAGSISIEITESFLMTNFDEMLQKLEILKNNGILVHLDDFGTAYSSLMYLKKLPIAAIKVDREFVKDICENEYSRKITMIIIDLCKGLGLTSIIEGVETMGQHAVIKKLGGDVIQGFLIGKSMPEESARLLIEESNKRRLLSDDE